MNEALYDAAYYDRMRTDSQLYTHFLSVVPIAEYRDKSVLDVGCGRGDLLRHLIEAGCRNIAGFDFSAAAVEQGRKLLGVSAKIKQGSVDNANLYQPGTFDLAFMTDVVEHLPPNVLHAGLSNVRRWLKPSGRLVIHTFPTLGPHRLYQWGLRLRGKTEELRSSEAIHCNVQTRKSMRAALERAGLEIERLWLQNDFTLTSSVYKSLKPGLLKSAIGTVAENVIGSAPVRAIFGEYSAMSIYAVTHPARQG